MPVKGIRPKMHPTTDSMISFILEKEGLEVIETAAKRMKMTLFEFLFAAISMVLG